jgi:GNAT superfamily N-acetyltransferase
MHDQEVTTDLADTGDAGPWERAPRGVEWRRGPYAVSTDPERLDMAVTAAFLAESYWATEIPEPVVRRSVEGSIAFGVYEDDRQVGFARVVSDRATFAWVGDVFILDSHRGRGLGLWLMRCVLAHPDLQELRRWLLASTSARGLYARLGFAPLAAPERFMEIADRDVHRRQRARDGGPDGDADRR